jgi:hypothetical protein
VGIFSRETCPENYFMVSVTNFFLNMRWDISASIMDTYRLHILIPSRGKNFSLL